MRSLLLSMALLLAAAPALADGRPARVRCNLAGTMGPVASPLALDCGVVPPRGTGEDPALRCAADSLASGTPFRLVTYQIGTDSTLQTGFVSDAEGRLHRFHYDSNICGGTGRGPGCGPRVEGSLCLGPEVDADVPERIDCVSTPERRVVCEPEPR